MGTLANEPKRTMMEVHPLTRNEKNFFCRKALCFLSQESVRYRPARPMPKVPQGHGIRGSDR
jgi:hypothetical protein